MPPRYDITQSYEWNYVHAPEAVPEVEVPPYPGEWDFLGIPVNSPLGIPAGPLLNSKWIHYYAKLGFDVLVYKTVRSGARASYDPPNLLPVAVADLAREGTEIEADPGAANPRTWAISFGMPSRAPEEWRPDVERARKGMGKGQALVVSVVASPRPGWTLDDLARDFARCGVWAAEAGAQVVEANLSCPNVCTQEADLYLDAKAAGVIAAELRARVPQLPLVLKIGLFPREEQAGALVEAVSPFVDGLSSANSITAVVRGEFGGLRRGIGGAAISRRCAEEIGMLKGIVARHGSGLRLIGVGGVMTGADVERRLAGGAHAVQMATAPMLDPEIALKIRRQKSNGNFAFLCTGLHTYKMIPVDTPVAEAQPETTATTQSFAEQVIAREKQYVLQNYGRYPLVLARGRGAWVYDPDGNRYLDLLSGIGVNALGHAHPRLLRVLREQAGLMIHISNLYYHEYQGRLAERLAKVSGLQRTFFCNSGAEAMEGAIKMVRAHGQSVDADKYEIVALENSFHGRTIGALSITGQPKYRKPFGPLMPGVKFVPVNDVAALEAAVSERTAGIVMEPVQGEGGVYPVPEAMLRKARELADRHDALLVFDEIQCGVGRMGTWFAYQGLDPVAMPDVLTSAKPIGCGIPIGFVICNERAAKTIPAGMHGTTFGGGPLATRVALEFMDVLEELLPQVRERGEYFRHKLELLKARYSFIKDVRVRGLMIGVELDRPGKELVTECMKEGLLINCTHEVVLRFLPPFIISESEIDKACRILSRVFKRWGA